MSIEEYISGLEEIRRKRRQLFKREEMMSRPIVRDMSLLGRLHKEFVADREKSGHDPDSPDSRRMFALVAIRLCSPASLAGGKLGNGVRGAVARELRCDPTLVSHMCGDLVFYYRTYRSFRRETDRCYEKMVSIVERITIENDEICKK